MPDDVRTCERHGFFEGATCPTCGDSGRLIVEGERRRQLSKYISGALRHFPEDAGLTLDGAGWTPFPDLVEAVESKYSWPDRGTVAGVVATDPNGRFERRHGDGTDRVRATYGHSVDVTLDGGDDPVPETLYHGTAPRNVESILTEGLRPMNRQQVHLSEDVESAVAVGRRHADEPAVLEIDAAAMQEAGRDIARRGRETYTTDRVPPRYLGRRGE